MIKDVVDYRAMEPREFVFGKCWLLMVPQRFMAKHSSTFILLTPFG